jgi:methionine-R-sulfoxide reductase
MKSLMKLLIAQFGYCFMHRRFYSRERVEINKINKNDLPQLEWTFDSRYLSTEKPKFLKLSQAYSIEGSKSSTATDKGNSKMGEEFKKDLKERLTPLQYHVTQEAGTERPFTGKYNKFYERGTYVCVVCHQELFSSDTKFDSGCGWPAFYDVLEKGRVTLHNDPSLGKYRKITACVTQLRLITTSTLTP